jgi:flagellar hook-basal body complex protein FliE
MGIETVGSIQDILNRYDSNSWAKSGNVDEFTELNFGDELKLQELGPAGKKQSFSEILASSVTDVNQLQKDANTAIQKLVTGESKNLHETMLAVEKADIAFKTMNQVRQKVIDAYKEVMRMQV